MKKLDDLRGKARRRALRLLKKIHSDGYPAWGRKSIFLHKSDAGDNFRDAERLHKARLITAVATRWSWGCGKRPFRELKLFLSENDARKSGYGILPR